MSISKRCRCYSKNLVLLLCTLVATYGLLEGSVRLFMRHLPMGFFNVQCRELKTVGQTSKIGLEPRVPYIAIVGDSYGAGKGDWLREERYNLNSRYQAAHVLQDKTGLDVVSYSKSGAGNFDGALNAINTFYVLRSYGFEYAEPETVFVYFYAGNDVGNNLRVYEKSFLPAYPGSLSEKQTRQAYSKAMQEQYITGQLPKLEDRFFAGNVIFRGAESIHYIFRAPKEPPDMSINSITALVDNRPAELPLFLKEESPLGSSSGQLTVAMDMLDMGISVLREYWPNAKFCLVYIPAPLSCYQLTDQTLAHAIRGLHEDLIGKIRLIAIKNSITFLDTTPALQQQAKNMLIHGPTDWTHFNRTGYTVLASCLYSYLGGSAHEGALETSASLLNLPRRAE